MADEKRHISVFENWLEAAECTPDPKETLWQLLDYGLRGTPFTLEDPASKAVFFSLSAVMPKKRGGQPDNKNAAGKHRGYRKKDKNESKNESLIEENINMNREGNINLLTGDPTPLDAGPGSAGPDWDQLLADINAEGGGDDDE